MCDYLWIMDQLCQAILPTYTNVKDKAKVASIFNQNYTRVCQHVHPSHKRSYVLSMCYSIETSLFYKQYVVSLINMYLYAPNLSLNNQEQQYFLQFFFFFFLLDFIYRGSLFSIFTTLIYHKVLINNTTEQDTEEDKQAKLLVEQFTYILTQLLIMTSVFQQS